MTPGGTTQETLQLNIETLWSGGPFADPVSSSFPAQKDFTQPLVVQNYNGGNKQPSERDTMAQAMKDIRQRIFQSPTGDIDSEYVLYFSKVFFIDPFQMLTSLLLNLPNMVRTAQETILTATMCSKYPQVLMQAQDTLSLTSTPVELLLIMDDTLTLTLPLPGLSGLKAMLYTRGLLLHSKF
jgi:hypothetical protein